VSIARQSSTDRQLDGVLVINMDQRPERLERFRQVAPFHAALQAWERFPAVDGQKLPGYGQQPWFRGRARDKGWAGRAGCTLSHRRAIELARQRGWRNVLILEDDVDIGSNFDGELDSLLRTLDACASGWRMCYLGVSQAVGPGRHLAQLDAGKGLYTVFGCLGTFAYILKAEAYDWVLAQLPDDNTIWPWLARHRAIDRWYARNLTRHLNVTAVSPSLIGHYASFSDIGQRAGAVISQSGTEEDHSRPVIGRHPLIFTIGSAALRLYFLIAGLGNQLRAWQKKRRGL
jgi:hypothetical protein